MSSDTAERCDCGYDFRGGALDSKNRAKRLVREIVKGIAGITAVVWFLAPITQFPVWSCSLFRAPWSTFEDSGIVILSGV